MSLRAHFACAAAVAALAVGSVVRGEETASSNNLTIGTPLYASDTSPGRAPNAPAPSATTRTPLMSLFDQVGIGQTLDDAHIRVFGHIEGSYTWNFDNPASNLNLGRVFDIEHNKGLVNQLDLNVERLVDLKEHNWDVGGRVELLYGTDARFIHANGMFDNDGDGVFSGNEYQFDIPQIYADVAIPVGNGLRLRMGKFLFFKQIDPNNSVFYSHSFSFGAALPFTLTGVTLYYPFTDQLSVEGGISRGWGQALEDNNGAIDGLARVRYTIGEHTDISVALIVGPELNHDNSHYRTTLDATLRHDLTDRLTILFDSVYGYQAQPDGMTDAMWYGVAGYAVYRLNDYLSLAARLEWYRDEEGFTTAVAQNLYEATIGVTITPFPNDPLGQNLKIRPELRGDYSSRPFFDGFSRHDQWTAAIDAYFNF